MLPRSWLRLTLSWLVLWHIPKLFVETFANQLANGWSFVSNIINHECSTLLCTSRRTVTATLDNQGLQPSPLLSSNDNSNVPETLLSYFSRSELTNEFQTNLLDRFWLSCTMKWAENKWLLRRNPTEILKTPSCLYTQKPMPNYTSKET